MQLYPHFILRCAFRARPELQFLAAGIAFHAKPEPESSHDDRRSENGNFMIKTFDIVGGVQPRDIPSFPKVCREQTKAGLQSLLGTGGPLYGVRSELAPCYAPHTPDRKRVELPR